VLHISPIVVCSYFHIVIPSSLRQNCVGAFGIIVVDLGTGESWRHLNQLHEVTPTSRFLPTLFGVPTFLRTPLSPSFHYENAGGGGGCDGGYLGGYLISNIWY
jgi:hypothetical protein